MKYANFLISHSKGSIDKKSASIHMVSPSQDSASGCFLWIPSTNLLTNSVFKGRTKTSHHNIFISKFKNNKTSWRIKTYLGFMRGSCSEANLWLIEFYYFPFLRKDLCRLRKCFIFSLWLLDYIQELSAKCLKLFSSWFCLWFYKD